MHSLQIPRVCIQLEAHECEITLTNISCQIYGAIKDIGVSLGLDRMKYPGGSLPPCFGFPFCTSDHNHYEWPYFRDFRDDILADLLQDPPLDAGECADIRRRLTDDLERLKQISSNKAQHLVAEDLDIVRNKINYRQYRLDTFPNSPLSHEDMGDNGKLEIQTRIRQMLDDDIASGLLVVNVHNGEIVVTLDNLVYWGFHRKIKFKQDGLPGCEPLIAEAYKRLHQRLRQRLSETITTVNCASTSPSGAKHQTPNATAPLPPQTDESGLSKREKQIRAIVALAIAQKYDVMSIPTGGKALLMEECKKAHSDLFGAGDDPFNDAWKAAVTANRLRTKHHERYARRD